MTLENLDKMIGSLWTNSAIKDCYKNLEENLKTVRAKTGEES